MECSNSFEVLANHDDTDNTPDIGAPRGVTIATAPREPAAGGTIATAPLPITRRRCVNHVKITWMSANISIGRPDAAAADAEDVQDSVPNMWCRKTIIRQALGEIAAGVEPDYSLALITLQEAIDDCWSILRRHRATEETTDWIQDNIPDMWYRKKIVKHAKLKL
jgi:hypothetical protein